MYVCIYIHVYVHAPMHGYLIVVTWARASVLPDMYTLIPWAASAHVATIM